MIFVDTGFLVALAQPTDSLQIRAVAWARSLSERLLVSEYVLWEVVNCLSRPADRPRAYRIVDWVSGNSQFELIHASAEIFADGLRLHRSRPDKHWSLTDCISFHSMRERGITRALAYDVHFEQAGVDPMLRRDPPA